MTDVAVFVHRAARRGRRAKEVHVALASLSEAGARISIIETASPAEVEDRSAELCARGAERIVVVGGDGLVHHVVQGVAGTATALGLVPVGTGNDFAAALELPFEPTRAAKVAMGPTRTLDLLHSAAGWAVSVATLGFSATVNERAEAMRWPRGRARYTVATVLELTRLETLELTLHLGGMTSPLAPAGGSDQGGSGAEHIEHRVRAALVAVANTPMFGGGMRICPDARADDGLADITVVEAIDRLSLLRNLLRVFRGTHVDHRSVSVYRARSVTLAAPDVSVAAVRADGEAWGCLPLTIEAVPGALQLAAPS